MMMMSVSVAGTTEVQLVLFSSTTSQSIWRLRMPIDGWRNCVIIQTRILLSCSLETRQISSTCDLFQRRKERHLQVRGLSVSLSKNGAHGDHVSLVSAAVDCGNPWKSWN